MKRLLQILVVPVLFAGVNLGTGAVSAQSAPFECGDISISNGNGTNSVNEITCENNVDIVINCDNNIRIDVDVDQDADSGDATGNGNTTINDITTGDAGNESFVGTEVDAACAAAAPAPTTPTPPVPPVGGGTVNGTTTVAVAPQVAALPNTGSATTLSYVLGTVAGLGTIAVLTQVVLAGSRRRALR